MLTVVLSLILFALAGGVIAALAQAATVVVPRIHQLRAAAIGTSSAREFAIQFTGHRVDPALASVVTFAHRIQRPVVNPLNDWRAAA